MVHCKTCGRMTTLGWLDTARIRHRHGKDTDFTYKSEVLDTIRHETLPISKYPCIIGWKWIELYPVPITVFLSYPTLLVVHRICISQVSHAWCTSLSLSPCTCLYREILRKMQPYVRRMWAKQGSS